MSIKIHVSGLVGLCLFMSGCGGSAEVEVVDLNKVLDVVQASLDEMGAAPADPASVTEEEKDKQISQFAKQTTEKLNQANISSQPLGFAARDDGSFEGFTDSNKDGFKDAGENQLFTVEIDAERNRLIASDTNGYHRDAGFSGTSMLTGMMAGMLISSMLNRQGAAGINSSRFSSMQMSPSNYHSAAQASAKASASARARSSSGSFSSGK